MMTSRLFSPPRSRVSSRNLYAEVSEYFDVGARLRRGSTLVDVGANIGAFALRAAEECDGDLRILAFEPSPDTFMALAANFADNELLRRTRHRLFQLGLSSDPSGAIAFYDFARFPTNSTFDLGAKRREFEIFFEEWARRVRERIENAVPGVGRVLGTSLGSAVASLPKGPIGWWITRRTMGLREVRVRVDTLARVLHEESVDRIDLLKIDAEGHELEILRGLDAATWAKVDQVVLETRSRHADTIRALLAEHGLARIHAARQRVMDNGLESVIMHARRDGAG